MRVFKKFVCLQCGKDFESNNYKKNRIPQCCSYTCAGLLRTKHEDTVRTCPICGLDFKTKKTGQKSNETCSIKCGNVWKNKENSAIVKCDFCGNEIRKPNSMVKEKNFCSMKCVNDYNREEKWIIKECPTCKKEFRTRVSRETNYCSIQCFDKSDFKREIVSISSSRTLKERGWSEEKLAENREMMRGFVALQKGKKLEEIYGSEKADGIREKFSKKYSGDNNPMSLFSISKRNNCSIEEASNLTPAKGRFKELHPMFGKHHTIESKISMMKKLSIVSWKTKYSCGMFDNLFWQGTWELYFIIECIENNIKIKRYDLEPFEYIFEDIPHHYFPDFIINENTIVEIKGFDKKLDRTIYKMNKFKERFDNFMIIDNIKIGMLAKNYLRMIKEKYGERLIINHNPHEKENVDN